MEQQAVNPYAAPQARVEDEPHADEAPPLWGPENAGAWSLLISVAFGAWIVWQNWKALGDEKRAASSAKWFYASLVAVFLMIVLPVGRAIGFVFLITWYFAQNKPQIKYIKERFGKNYPHRGWTVPVLSGLAILVVCSVIFGLISVLLFNT